MRTSARKLLLLGGALILLVNAIALGGIAYNRSGVPEATLRLGERELDLPAMWQDQRDNSGVSFELRWQDSVYQPGYSAYGTADWLDAGRLAALGFELSVPEDESSGRRWREQAREVWLALELDGSAYAQSLSRASDAVTAARRAQQKNDDASQRYLVEAAREQAKDVRDKWSRLFVIDTDLDPAALRARHPNREQVAIMRGRVRPIWVTATLADPRDGEWRGHVEAISIDSIHVPLEFRDRIQTDGSERWRLRKGDVVTLAFGRRMEPWIVAVDAEDPDR